MVATRAHQQADYAWLFLQSQGSRAFSGRAVGDKEVIFNLRGQPPIPIGPRPTARSNLDGGILSEDRTLQEVVSGIAWESPYRCSSVGCLRVDWTDGMSCSRIATFNCERTQRELLQ